MCFRNKIVIWWTRRLSTVASLRYLAGECLPPPDVMAKRQSMSVLFTYIYNSFTPSEIFYSSCLWWTQILLLSILVISACFLFCDYQTQSFTAKFLKYSSCQREQLEYTRQEDEANQTAVSRLWVSPRRKHRNWGKKEGGMWCATLCVHISNFWIMDELRLQWMVDCF